MVHGAADHAHNTSLPVMLLSAIGSHVNDSDDDGGDDDDEDVRCTDPADDCDDDDDRDVAAGTGGDHGRAGTQPGHYDGYLVQAGI